MQDSELLTLVRKVRKPRKEMFTLWMDLFVQPKERPRKGKNGIFYTPPKTAKFEKEVRDAARKRMQKLNLSPLVGALSVELFIYEEIDFKWSEPNKLLCEMGFIVPMTEEGDIDNKTKAIFDALNGVVYRDDCQIAHKEVEHSYRNVAGFSLKIVPTRALRKSEAVLIEKLALQK